MDPAARNTALLGWYDAHRRDLPWRWTSDPWAVLTSEVMLQQTQAARVAARYPRFLAQYPDPSSLASAPLAEALALWDGLGYPRRLGRLRETARILADRGWPQTVDGLRQLPGVGRYTAAAVACFAFGVAVAAVDTNLRRVLSRWEGRSLAGDDLAKTAEASLDGARPADWNQAVMDLGAAVCRPTPSCGRCPVTAWCADPGVQISVRGQSTFSGSHREARGAALRALIAGPGDAIRLAERAGIQPERLVGALEGLVVDGLVERDGGGFRLPG